jgi:hypothetical protein
MSAQGWRLAHDSPARGGELTSMLDRPQRAGKEEKKDERSGSWCLVVPRVPGGCQQPALAMPCCCCCAPACRRAPSQCSTTTRRVAALVISGQLVAGVRQSAGPFDSPSNPGAHHPPGRARRQELSGSGLPLQQQLPVDIGDCVYGQRHFTRAIRQQRTPQRDSHVLGHSPSVSLTKRLSMLRPRSPL